jgi:hypothetical protein
MKLRRLVPNPYIHVSVSNLYIPTNGLPILQQYRWTDRGNIQIAHRNMNVDIGNEAAQSSFWEYINRIFFAVWTEHLLSPIHQHKGLEFLPLIEPALSNLPPPPFPHVSNRKKDSNQTLSLMISALWASSASCTFSSQFFVSAAKSKW